MAALGDTLRSNPPSGQGHIWIVASDPQTTQGQILLVNLTTLHEGCVDDACILGPSDYVLLTHQTTVAYSRSRVVTEAKLDAAIANGAFSPVPSLPLPALQRVLAGARASRELSARSKRLLPPP